MNKVDNKYYWSLGERETVVGQPCVEKAYKNRKPSLPQRQSDLDNFGGERIIFQKGYSLYYKAKIEINKWVLEALPELAGLE